MTCKDQEGTAESSPSAQAESEKETKVCKNCQAPFTFDYDKSLYTDLCEQCAIDKYPLAREVRRRILDDVGSEAARDIFGPEHQGCLPESMLGDPENLLLYIASFFRTIAQVIAEAAGMSSKDYTVMVEPSYEDTTWWMILKQMPGAFLPSPARTQVAFFEYTKAWNLGELSEDHVEEILRGWKEEVAANVRKGEAVQLIIDALESENAFQTLGGG